MFAERGEFINPRTSTNAAAVVIRTTLICIARFVQRSRAQHGGWEGEGASIFRDIVLNLGDGSHGHTTNSFNIKLPSALRAAWEECAAQYPQQPLEFVGIATSSSAGDVDGAGELEVLDVDATRDAVRSVIQRGDVDLLAPGARNAAKTGNPRGAVDRATIASRRHAEFHLFRGVGKVVNDSELLHGASGGGGTSSEQVGGGMGAGMGGGSEPGLAGWNDTDWNDDSVLGLDELNTDGPECSSLGLDELDPDGFECSLSGVVAGSSETLAADWTGGGGLVASTSGGGAAAAGTDGCHDDEEDKVGEMVDDVFGNLECAECGKRCQYVNLIRHTRTTHPCATDPAVELHYVCCFVTTNPRCLICAHAMRSLCRRKEIFIGCSPVEAFEIERRGQDSVAVALARAQRGRAMREAEKKASGGGAASATDAAGGVDRRGSGSGASQQGKKRGTTAKTPKTPGWSDHQTAAWLYAEAKRKEELRKT